MKNLISFLFLSFFYLSYSSSHEKVIKPMDFSSAIHQTKQELILNGIYEAILKVSEKELIKEEKEKPKSSLNEGRRGTMIVEEMMRKNRERLAAQSGLDPNQAKSGKDIVNFQKKDNKNMIQEMDRQVKKAKDWKELAQSEIDMIRASVMQKWKEKNQKVLQDWKQQKILYKNNVNKYGKTTFDIPLVLPVNEADLKKSLKKKVSKESFVVANSMGMKVKNQKFRATCASFSGLRSLEILLGQNQYDLDLSEQYFYWASKSDCQNKKCSSRGSWVGHGLKFSQNASKHDIPLEEDCPYNPFSAGQNETQIPLKNSCDQGKVKIGHYNYHKTLDELIEALHQNTPVVIGTYLTPNFYDADSLILERNKNEGRKKMDSHSKGHSLLVVGYVKLPQVLNEGNLCLIVTNSWGEGWGFGGYSCLSEKWFLEQRQANPFVSIDLVSYRK
ncbi:C1 family peptidase [Bacteriovoracaceae bacterium]|nr:C1 family peptidase [Bacteriovoracaceae bacterium]